MVNSIKEKLSVIPKDSNIYLIEAINYNSGFFASDGHVIYLIANQNNAQSESIETDFLSLNTTVNIRAVENDSSFKDGNYDLIVFKDNIGNDNFESFIKLCVSYSYNSSEISFKEFFYSLITLFQLQSEQNLKNAIGLYGELKFMQYIWDKFAVDMSAYWHKTGSMSKYDFSNNKYAIETKTTSKTNKLITIKHKQLFEVKGSLLAAIMCDRDDNGETIYELLEEFKSIPQAFKNLNFSLNLAKELKRVAVDDFSKTRFSLYGVNVFNCDEINPFRDIPNNVSNLSYDLDLEDEDVVEEEYFLKTIYDMEK